MRTFHVYIMADRSRRLYVGVTGHLERRIMQHRLGESSFTRRYRMYRLVYVESTGDVRAAIAREKQIKAWRRSHKLSLIGKANPAWDDLAEGWPVLCHTRDRRSADPSLRSG